MKIAIYAGSFDPITNGHLKIIERAAKLFDKIIVLVAVNPSKNTRFTTEEKVKMIKDSVKIYQNVEVDSYDGLTVEYAKKVNATHLIRGLRAVSDFEYEFQMGAVNEYIDSNIDTVYFMSHNNFSFISSSSVHEMALNSVDISHLVPESVLKMYKEKYLK